MYKKIFVILFLGVCSTKGFCQANLYVKNKSNEQTIIPLSEIQRLTFTSGKLSLLKTDGQNTTYSLSTLRYLSFTEYKDVTPVIPTDVFGETILTAPSLFPNPVKNRLFIQSSNRSDVEVINAVGEIVIQSIQVTETGIDVSSLTPGMYLCRIQQGDTQIIKRFIKE